MDNNDQSNPKNKLTTTRENYKLLIKLIEDTFEKIYQNKTQLVDDTHDGLYLNIHALINKEELEQSVAENEWVIDQIAERNFQRHRALVSLIKERTELRRLIIRAPTGAGGIRRNTKIEQKIEDIERRIEAIVAQAER